MLTDLRHALRMLVKNPGFTWVAVLTLALCIGANTAVFSLVNEVVLKSLPVKEPEKLVLFDWLQSPRGMSIMGEVDFENDPVTKQDTCTSFTKLTFDRFREQNKTLSEVFAFAALREPNVNVDGHAEISRLGQVVSGEYYTGLRVGAFRGRTITPEDDRPDAPPVAMISFNYWQHRFGGDPAAVGKRISVNNTPVVVIGVTPPGFDGTMNIGEAPDISLPLAMVTSLRTDSAGLNQPWYWWLRIMGRLKPGTTAGETRASLDGILRQTALEGADAKPHDASRIGEAQEPPRLRVNPGDQGLMAMRRSYAWELMIMMGLVSVVLLIGCANLAGLMLTRGAARRRELAIRMAVGASRRRLVRHLLVESVLLALLGGGLGVLLAFWGRDLLLASQPLGQDSFVLNLELDRRVLSFTAVVAAGTGLLFGLVPAWRATRLDLNAEFHGGGRNPASGSTSRLGKLLMAAQVALSMVLLVGAGLFTRTLINLNAVNVGFNREHLLLFRIDGTPSGYKTAQFAGLHTGIAEGIAAIPGVQSVTFSRVPLLSEVGWGQIISVPGHSPSSGRPDFAMLNAVGVNFFATLEIPILTGRSFSSHDTERASKVAVINQTFARTYFGDHDPVGRRVGLGRNNSEGEVEIVGVARDAKYENLKRPVRPILYLPFLQSVSGEANFFVRTRGEPEAVLGSIRRAVGGVDANLPLYDVRTQDAQVERLFTTERLFARLSGLFGLLAIGLVCIGLYGLMSYAVLRRTTEIGIRMALGALPGRVLRMVLREALAIAGLGAALGLAASFAASKLVTKLLFGLSGTDPITYAGVTLILVVVALTACWLPARRAARVDPVVAVRNEG